jgi:hypothetical protein
MAVGKVFPGRFRAKSQGDMLCYGMLVSRENIRRTDKTCQLLPWGTLGLSAREGPNRVLTAEAIGFLEIAPTKWLTLGGARVPAAEASRIPGPLNYPGAENEEVHTLDGRSHRGAADGTARPPCSPFCVD